MLDFFPEYLSFIPRLLILFLAARILGELMERIGLIAIVGEILAGVLLGPSVLNIISSNENLKVLSEIGVLFLVIMSGMELDINRLYRMVNGRRIMSPVLSFIIPLLGGIFISWLLSFDVRTMIFMGLFASSMALPVAIRALIDINIIDTNVSQRVIINAVFSDIMVLLILGIIVNFKGFDSNYLEILSFLSIQLLKIFLFAAIVLFSYKKIKKIGEKVNFMDDKIDKFINLFKSRETMFGMVMGFILVFASFAEVLGLHFVVGSFLGSILLSREILGNNNFKKIQNNINSITMGFFAPVFFAYLGLQFNLDSLNNVSLLLLVMVIMFLLKIAGGYAGALSSGINRKESILVGIGNNFRGLIDVLIIDIAYKNNFIDASFYSLCLFLVLISTVITPILFKNFFKYTCT